MENGIRTFAGEGLMRSENALTSRRSAFGRLVASLVAFILLFAALAASSFALPAGEAMAATYKISSTAVPSSVAKMKTTVDNMSVVSKSSSVSVVKTDGNASNTYTSLVVNIKDTNKAWTITDFCKIKFTNAGMINGRQTDVYINFDELEVSAKKDTHSSQNTSKMAFAQINKKGIGISASISFSKYGYHAVKRCTMTVEVRYHDDQSLVNESFFHGVSDLDLPLTTSSSDYYNESVNFLSGYTNKFYVYSQSNLTGSGMTSGGKVFSHGKNAADIEGNDSWYKAGVFAPTQNGKFTFLFQDGNCKTQLEIFSSYKSLQAPKITADKDTVHEGEAVKWSVTQPIGKLFQDIVTPYSALQLSFPVPEECEYAGPAGVQVFSGANDVTKQGTISYNSDTRTVIFTFNSAFYGNQSNYKGQTLKMNVPTTVKQTQETSTTGNGTTRISSFTQNTNDDTVKIIHPAISLAKTADPVLVEGSDAKEGATVSYGFVIRNEGDCALSGVSVIDDLEGVSALHYTWPQQTAGLLAPGESASAIATYSVKQEDVDAGRIDNTARATGQDPLKATATSPDAEASTALRGTAGISLVKEGALAELDKTASVGDKVEYTFTVRNTGTVSLSSVSLSDDLVEGGAIALQKTELAPGEETTGTAEYSLTQDDIDSGIVHNEATVTALPPAPAYEGEVSAKDDCDVAVPQMPKLSLVKTSSPASLEGAEARAGAKITYSLVMENEGNTTLRGVRAEDHLAGTTEIEYDWSGAAGEGVLLPGQSATAKCEYILTQEDVERGGVKNMATAYAEIPPESSSIEADDETETVVAGTASLSLSKTVAETSLEGEDARAGAVLHYSFKIENTGTLNVSDVSVQDDLAGIGGVLYDWDGSSDPGTGEGVLSPGETVTATAEYAVLQEDVDAGSVCNVARATGTSSAGDAVSLDAEATTTIAPAPGISLEKTASPDALTGEGAVAGTRVEFSFEIRNTGNVSLSGVSLEDALEGLEEPSIDWDASSDPDTQEGVLSPGEAVAARAGYVLTQEDVDSGGLTNTATASGSAPDGTKKTAEDDARVSIEKAPSISLVKSADAERIDDAAAGDVIRYSFVVANDGNTTLETVRLLDPKIAGDASLTLSKTTLAPGDTATAEAVYEIAQEDVDAGNVHNEASVEATPKNGGDPVSAKDEADVALGLSPSIDILKSVSPAKVPAADAKPGYEVEYTFTVRNTGNATLHDVSVSDALIEGGVSLDKDVLAPNETTTATATHALTQDDINAGSVLNTASVEGFAPNGERMSDEDDAECEIERTASVSLSKTADRQHISKATPGDAVEYTIVARNTGNTTLADGAIEDPMLSDAPLTQEKALGPGETGAATVEYSIKQSDIDAGRIDNTATTSWTAFDGAEKTAEASWSIEIDRHPGIDIVKTVEGGETISNAKAGDKVRFRIEVENTGDVTLRDVSLEDRLEGAIVDETGFADVLGPGDKTVAYADYVLKQEDVDKGDVENVASVSATPPDGLATVSDEDDAKAVLPAMPSIALDKVADATVLEGAKSGDGIAYTLTVQNTGNVSLSDVSLSDPLLGGDVSSALGKCDLAPGETAQAVIPYALTQSDIDAGFVKNTAEATGKEPNGGAVSAEDDATVELSQAPAISLEKTVAPADGKEACALAVGDEVEYTFVIANVGNTSLTGVSLEDAMLGGAVNLDGADFLPSEEEGSGNGGEQTGGEVADDAENAPINGDADSANAGGGGAGNVGASFDGVLLPGERITVSVGYTLTQEDFDAGTLANEATASGDAPGGETVEDVCDALLALPTSPALALEKKAERDVLEDAREGDEIVWTITATNTGNVSLHSLRVEELLEGATIEGADVFDGLVLAPGESVSVEAAYAVGKSDIDRGYVLNEAKAFGTSSTYDGEDGDSGKKIEASADSTVALETPVVEPVVPEPQKDTPAAGIAEVLLTKTGVSSIAAASVGIALIAASAAAIAKAARNRSGKR